MKDKVYQTMEFELYDHRPDPASVSDVENRCYDCLEQLNVPFLRIDHEPADTIEICHPIERNLGAKICKNLFLANPQQTVFYLLLIPGDKPFKTKYLSKQINSSRLSFGSAEKMMELLNIAPGSVSVFGLMNDKEKAVNLLIDEDLKNDEYIGFHPCKNTSTLKIRYDDLLERFLPGINRTFQYVELPWTFDEE